GTPLALVAPRATYQELLYELRSLYAATLATPDLKPIEKADRVLLPDWPFAVWPVALHPSGQAMVLGLATGPVHWQRGTRPKLPATIDRERPRPRLAYSPDGNHLVFARADGALQVWDREVTRYRELEKAGQARALAIGFSPASKGLVVLRWDGR